MKAFSAGKLTLKASMCAAYVAQSMVKDFYKLSEAIQNGSDCADLLVAVEPQSKFLADISSDIIKSTAVTSGSVVSAHKYMDERLES